MPGRRRTRRRPAWARSTAGKGGEAATPKARRPEEKGGALREEGGAQGPQQEQGHELPGVMENNKVTTRKETWMTSRIIFNCTAHT